jgi:hypothetical protein
MMKPQENFSDCEESGRDHRHIAQREVNQTRGSMPIENSMRLYENILWPVLLTTHANRKECPYKAH